MTFIKHIIVFIIGVAMTVCGLTILDIPDTVSLVDKLFGLLLIGGGGIIVYSNPFNTSTKN